MSVDEIDRNIWSHDYAVAVAAARAHLMTAPADLAAIGLLARALRACGDYQDAIPYFERLDVEERSDPTAPGHPGRRVDLACLDWMLDRRERAISTMRQLVQGVVDRSIKYGDNAGGVTQGNLLYYMAVTAHRPADTAVALKYLKGRAKRVAIEVWPGPVARLHLGEVDFDFVLAAATGESKLERALGAAETDLLKRRRLCVALFHDGARNRASGNEAACIDRFWHCRRLENPIIENEWYLARHELEQHSRPD